tara:strand:+ start:513 stop:1409 length:897 start_codon:yes stop_codon:yes gene_type:complete
MIIDSFLYYNEIELLELRLKVLYDYVDRFVIVEGDHTHKGDPIPFRCKKDLKTLGFENDPKIHVIELNLKSFDEEEDPWVRSAPARNAQAGICLKTYQSIYDLKNDDILVVADVDELWHPHYLENYLDALNANRNAVMVLKCHDLQFRADLILNFDDNERPVNAPLIAYGSFWKNHLPTDCRKYLGGTIASHAKDIPFEVYYVHGVKQGWHLSWMGDEERQLTKINTSCHWKDEIYGDGEKLESDYIRERISNYNPKNEERDLLGRNRYSLKEFDYTELFEVIGDLPHIKDFLLNRNI